MKNEEIISVNKNYWDTNADSWFGVTSLPYYGVSMVTENELELFKDVKGKTLLEIGCGSGHSIKYLYDRGAKEIQGLDLSEKQLINAKKYLNEHNYKSKFYNASMDADVDIPTDYFDVVYSIYAIGWATDLNLVFKKIYTYLKEGGTFIFSWKHPLHTCVKVVNESFIFEKSYFDESMKTQSVDDMDIILSARKISTYINALVKAGFKIEQMIEETDQETLNQTGDMTDRSKKAQMVPLSFLFKVRK